MKRSEGEADEEIQWMQGAAVQSWAFCRKSPEFLKESSHPQQPGFLAA